MKGPATGKPRRPDRRAFLVLGLLVGLLGSCLALAQDQTKWARRRVGLLVLESPATHERSLATLATRAQQIIPEVEQKLGARPTQRYHLILIPPEGVPDSTLSRIDEMAPPWAAGYMIPSRRVGAIRVAQAARYPYGTVESVLAHEAAHLILHDAVGGKLPLWFEEGVATWIGRRWSFEDAMVYSGALLTSSLPRLAELDTLFEASADEARLAYAASNSFVSWNVSRHGPTFLRDVLRATRTSRFEVAWRTVTGAPLQEAEKAWRQSSLIRYRWIPAVMASGTLWATIAFLAVIAGARRRARARKAREQWDLEEAQAEATPEPPTPGAL